MKVLGIIEELLPRGLNELYDTSGHLLGYYFEPKPEFYGKVRQWLVTNLIPTSSGPDVLINKQQDITVEFSGMVETDTETVKAHAQAILDRMVGQPKPNSDFMQTIAAWPVKF